MTGALVIAILGTQSSGAAGDTAVFPSSTRRALADGSSVSAPEKCPSARRAVRFYQRRYNVWAVKMGAPTSTPAALTRCPQYLAKLWQRKARAMRLRYARWVEYHFHWQAWLPDKWQRVGACETGYGRRPGSWTWDSGTYVSAFGIYRAGYSQFAHEIGQLSWDETRSRLGRYPTPREQYNVALEIARRFGYGAWGCGSA